MSQYQDYPSSSIASTTTSSQCAFDGLDSFLNPGFTFPSHFGTSAFNPLDLPEPSRPDDGTIEMTFTFPTPAPIPTSNSDSTGTFRFRDLFPPSSSGAEVHIHEMRLAELEEYVFPPCNNQPKTAFAYETLLNLSGACGSEPSSPVVEQEQAHDDFDYWLNLNQTTVAVDGFGGSGEGSDALMDAYKRGLDVRSLEQ